jgi:hypothetical protein
MHHDGKEIPKPNKYRFLTRWKYHAIIPASAINNPVKISYRAEDRVGEDAAPGDATPPG